MSALQIRVNIVLLFTYIFRIFSIMFREFCVWMLLIVCNVYFFVLFVL